MEIRIDYLEDIGVVRIKGELDAHTAPDLTQFFNTHSAEGHMKFVADLEKLDYSSSAGVRVFLGVARETRQQGGDLRIAAVQPQVSKIFKLSKFDRIVKIFSTVDEAVQSYSE